MGKYTITLLTLAWLPFEVSMLMLESTDALLPRVLELLESELLELLVFTAAEDDSFRFFSGGSPTISGELDI